MAIKFEKSAGDHFWTHEKKSFESTINQLFQLTPKNFSEEIKKAKQFSVLWQLNKQRPSELLQIVQELDKIDRKKINADNLLDFAGTDLLKEFKQLENAPKASEKVSANILDDLSYRILKTIDSYLDSKPKLNQPQLPSHQHGPYR